MTWRINRGDPVWIICSRFFAFLQGVTRHKQGDNPNTSPQIHRRLNFCVFEDTEKMQYSRGFTDVTLKKMYFNLFIYFFYTYFVFVMTNTNVNFSIVNGMLATKQTKAILQLGKVTQLNNAVLNAEKQRFLNSCELGRLLFKTSEAFNDLFKAYKEKAKDEKLLKDEIADKGLFIEHVYGFQKSWYYKLIKVGEIESEKVSEYVDLCEKTKGAKMTIENLLIWAKAKNNPEIDESEIGVDSESIADLKATNSEDRAKKVYFVNLSINGEFLESKQGVALKIGEDLKLETANNLNDILKALDEIKEVVQAQLSKVKAVSQKEAKKIAEKNAKLTALKDMELA